MKQLNIENELRDVVARLILQVELATAQGRTDINLALEDAFIPILKSVFNLPHLINLNRKQKNYPGIDLGDDHDRVAFQVTSTTTLDKVKKTVGQFMERKYFNTFDELFILMLLPKQSSYSQTSINELLDERFTFNAKKHIIDLGDLLAMVTELRVAAQERVLSEFKQILGDVNAYNSFSADTVEAPAVLTSNLLAIELPEHIYVADLAVDEKTVLERAKAELGYKRKTRKKRSIVKMALVLNEVETDSWVVYENKLFSFHDIEASGLSTVVEQGTVERLDAEDLAYSDEIDNVNIYKQLLFAETQELLKQARVRTHPRDRFFFFGPKAEGDRDRKETWIGKKKAVRTVYEIKQQTKDPTKVAHHKHLSFDLTFTQIGEVWYAQVTPNWYYSYNGYKRSRWHEDLLTTQKKREFNLTVRNMTRFTAYFLRQLTAELGSELQFGSLVEFNTQAEDEDAPLLDDDTDGAEAAA